MVARIAGKYDVVGVLGEGGTGIVYDAVRISDGAAVALKVMHDRLAGDAQIRGRFRREAAILRRLEGPHICPIYELGEVDGDSEGTTVLYIALPKLRGPSLERVMKAEGGIAQGRALDVMSQVLSALEFAHGQGVIHRDLKPANVVLEPGDRVVVVDFGLAKIVAGTGAGTTNLTVHNMLFGTPEYMAPEQARGDDLDVRCDVYSAGVMLYEILTGGPPFTGTTPLGVLTAHLTSELEPPSKRRPDVAVSPAIEAVALHALARDRDARYASAAALRSALARARSRPEDVASVRPNVLRTAAGADAFAATIPALQPVASSSPPPPASYIPPARPADASTRTWVLLWILAAAVSIAVGVYVALR